MEGLHTAPQMYDRKETKAEGQMLRRQGNKTNITHHSEDGWSVFTCADREAIITNILITEEQKGRPDFRRVDNLKIIIFPQTLAGGIEGEAQAGECCEHCRLEGLKIYHHTPPSSSSSSSPGHS